MKLFPCISALFRRRPALFAKILREYIDWYKQDKDLQPQTAEHYEVYYRNSAAFFSDHHLWKLTIHELRERHAEDFRSFLRGYLPSCTVRRASRHVELWKRATRYAMRMEYCDSDHLAPIRPQRDPRKKIITLEKPELFQLINHDFRIGMFRVVADLFLFQCFTGLSYSDIYQHEITHKNGKYWIEGARQKTGKDYKVWVFEEAAEIYGKYQGELPRISNQKYNEYLKEIAYITGIKKRLTTHIGRKTFATLMAENGAGTKAISLMLGNTERICEESYVRPTRRIITNDLERAGIGSRLLG